MSTFTCPHCKAEHDIGDYPDHLTDLGADGACDFRCTCGAEFACQVDWEPVIRVVEPAAPEKAGQ